ncbi:MAG: hypothetical protein KDD53_09310, partial [Bdellovibrionales bacterium]|nr:hypothetical protein [Bdellovibrionales bacterium]
CSWALLVFPFIFSGCFFISSSAPLRSASTQSESTKEYYAPIGSYSSFEENLLATFEDYSHKRYFIQTPHGEISVEYFGRKEPSEDLILVFPLLGGRNGVESYFARYFAENGFDAAIINRDKEFKKAENFDKIEEIFRNNVIRDRIAMTFFEEKLGKKNFGSFGISRGAINAALTAGIDPRMKYNVFAMGAQNLPGLIVESRERRLVSYVKDLTAERDITVEELRKLLSLKIKSDPRFYAQNINPQNTLMFLALFDSSIPLEFGLELRRSAGYPDTVFLPAGHRTAALFTRFIPIFPFDYIEQESLNFYRRSFKRESATYSLVPIKILQIPFNLIGTLIDKIRRD